MFDLRLFFGRNRNIILFACDTFAWFTSSDEVTNRLTASGNYGVEVYEDFTPPDDDWTPGQEITKGVQALNTGNVDAYVKLGIESIFTVKLEDTTELLDAKSTSLTTTNIPNLIALGNLKYGDANYGKDTSAKEQAKALQAGGTMVVAGGKTLADLAKTDFTLTNGKLTANSKTGTNTTVKPVKDGAWLIDADTYTPDAGDGLYIFRREIQDTTVNSTTKTYYAYAGYYYDETNQKFYALSLVPNTVTDNNNDVVTVTDDLTVRGFSTASGTYTYTDDTSTEVNVTFDKPNITNVKFRKTTTFSNANPSAADTGNKGNVTYQYVTADATKSTAQWSTTTDFSAATHIRATYDPDYTAPAPGGTYTDANTANNTVVYIKLNAIADEKKLWLAGQADADGAEYGDFLYSTVLKSGEKTKKLIESVTLGDEVGNNAFYDLTYDLNVTVDSVQANKNQGGTYSDDAIKAEWGSGNPFTFGDATGNYQVATTGTISAKTAG